MVRRGLSLGGLFSGLFNNDCQHHNSVTAIIVTSVNRL